MNIIETTQFERQRLTLCELNIVVEHVLKHGVQMVLIEIEVMGVHGVDDLVRGVRKYDSFEQQNVVIHLVIPGAVQRVLSGLS